MTGRPDLSSPSAGRVLARRNRPGRWVQILLGLVIFVSGMVLGGSGALLLEKRIILDSIRHPEKVPGRMTRQMRDKLNLTEAQAEAILEILTRRQERLQALQREVQPRFEAEFDAVRQEIVEVLDPDQATRYDAWYAKVRKTWTPAVPGAGEPERE